jgi:hypothetical protein
MITTTILYDMVTNNLVVGTDSALHHRSMLECFNFFEVAKDMIGNKFFSEL